MAWMVCFQSQSGLRIRRGNGVSSTLSSNLKAHVQLENSKIGIEKSLSLRFFFFPRVQALNGLDEAYSHGGGQSALLSLPIQMLISSRNTLQDTLRNYV